MSVHRIARGLDIPLAGAPQGEPEVAPAPAFVAWVAADYEGIIRPRAARSITASRR